MAYRQMNSQEVADLLGTDRRRVERLAQRGEIPCQKVQGEYRFHRAALVEWLQQHMATLADDHLAEVDAGLTAHREEPTEQFIITPQLHKTTIDVSLAARTRGSVLRSLVRMAADTGLLHDPDALLDELEQREALRSTALEGGLAIPHPKRPLPYVLAEPVLVIAHVPHGVGFGAPDGRLTDLFFMQCSCDDRHHLHTLARLCRMLSNNTFAQELRAAEDAEAVMELVREREQVIIAG